MYPLRCLLNSSKPQEIVKAIINTNCKVLQMNVHLHYHNMINIVSSIVNLKEGRNIKIRTKRYFRFSNTYFNFFWVHWSKLHVSAMILTEVRAIFACILFSSHVEFILKILKSFISAGIFTAILNFKGIRVTPLHTDVIVAFSALLFCYILKEY